MPTTDRWTEILDAEAYFKGTAELWEEAQNWIAVVGWQLDSRICLVSNLTLKERILSLCKRKPKLRFYLLL